MNDHPAKPHDLVIDHGRPSVVYTVHHIEPSSDPADPTPVLVCTWSTGDRPIRRRASEMDVITHLGVA